MTREEMIKELTDKVNLLLSIRYSDGEGVKSFIKLLRLYTFLLIINRISVDSTTNML